MVIPCTWALILALLLTACKADRPQFAILAPDSSRPSATTQWLTCSYNWDGPSQANHLLSRPGWQWSGVPEGEVWTSIYDRLLQEEGVSFQLEKSQHEALEVHKRLLKESAHMLQRLNVNWWIMGGFLLGWMRSGTMIPWDHDVDLAIGEQDYGKLFDFVDNGGEANRSPAQGDITLVWRLEPTARRSMMVAAKGSDGLVKGMMYMDLATRIGLEWEKKPSLETTKIRVFGDIEVNRPADPWAALLDHEHHYDCDALHHRAPMSTSYSGSSRGMTYSGWSCKSWKCDGTPPFEKQQTSLAELYLHNVTSQTGPFHFHMDDAGVNGQCSLPRTYTSCASGDAVQKQVWLAQCVVDGPA